MTYFVNDFPQQKKNKKRSKTQKKRVDKYKCV